jgi:hypothetical protein
MLAARAANLSLPIYRWLTLLGDEPLPGIAFSNAFFLYSDLGTGPPPVSVCWVTK